MILSPKNMETRVPAIKNGAKGISLFSPFFCKSISINPIIAPKKKDKNNPARMLGKPNKSPKRMASFTSPKPIQAPLDIKNISRKKPEAR